MFINRESFPSPLTDLTRQDQLMVTGVNEYSATVQIRNSYMYVLKDQRFYVDGGLYMVIHKN